MVGKYNPAFCHTFFNGLLYKLQTPFVFMVEII